MLLNRLKFIIGLFVLLGISANAQQKFQKTLVVNGRIQADYEFLQRENSNEKFNGFEFRRIHVSFAGKLSPSLKYKIETNFGDSKIGIRDVYIKYVNKKFGNFAIGSMAEPTGLDMATSSKYIPFFERAMITSMQNFRWGTGLHYENYSLLDSRLSLQMSMTNNGASTEGFKDAHLEDGNNYIFRVAGTPFLNKEANQLLHVGFNFASRPYKDLKFRPENHMGDKYSFAFPDATNRQEMGYEIASTFGGISLQAEYKTQSLKNNLDKDYTFNGYYVMGSFFVTGEHRPYKNSAFARVKPKKDIDNGGFGALELLARYSSMKASQDVVDANPTTAGQVNNISLGFNWYLTSHTRIMYNYIITDDNDSVLGNLSGHLFRVALDF